MTLLAAGRPLPEGALPQAGAARAALPRRDPVTRLPILILYPHSRCNCRCLMCDIWRTTGREQLTADEVAGWVEEWRRLGVERVVLSGGEPLLHSRIESLCRSLVDAGIGITLLSTGLLLKRHAERLLPPGRAPLVDEVVVSLDGPREVHDEIRNLPGAFDQLAAGVAALRRARSGEEGSDALSLTARCTVQQVNFRHLCATARAARQVGFDRFSLLAVDVSSEAFDRPGGWSAERSRQVALTAADLPVLEAELERLHEESEAAGWNGFLAESPAKLRRRLLEYFRALTGGGDFPAVECNAPWVSSVVEADGTVRPCFFQPPLGNLREAGSLEAVLNSPAALAFRRGLDVAQDPICRRCVCSLNLRADTRGTAGGTSS